MQLQEQSGKVDRYNGTRLYCVREHGVVPVPCAVANAENGCMHIVQQVLQEVAGHCRAASWPLCALGVFQPVPEHTLLGFGVRSPYIGIVGQTCRLYPCSHAIVRKVDTFWCPLQYDSMENFQTTNHTVPCICGSVAATGK